MKYVAADVGNPWGPTCNVLMRGQWMLAGFRYKDLLAVEKDRPADVTFMGNLSEVHSPEVPETSTRWQTFLYHVTDDAYDAASLNTEEQR